MDTHALLVTNLHVCVCILQTLYITTFLVNLLTPILSGTIHKFPIVKMLSNGHAHAHTSHRHVPKWQKATEEHRSVFHHVCYLCYQDGSSLNQSLNLSIGQTHIVKQARKIPERSARVSPSHHTHTCSHQNGLSKNPHQT